MNAGAEGAVVVGELLKTDDPQWGHNAATGEYCNMIQAGIIDPTKVYASAHAPRTAGGSGKVSSGRCARSKRIFHFASCLIHQEALYRRSRLFVVSDYVSPFEARLEFKGVPASPVSRVTSYA